MLVTSSSLVCMCVGQQGDEGSFVSWGSSACPCVEKVQGSSLLPVRVERKITLLARNLHLYQVHTHTHTLSTRVYVPGWWSPHLTCVLVCSGHWVGLWVRIGHRRADGGGGSLCGDRWQQSIKLWHHLSTAPGLIMCTPEYNRSTVWNLYPVNVIDDDKLMLFEAGFNCFCFFNEAIAVCPVHIFFSCGGIQCDGVCEEEGHLPCWQLSWSVRWGARLHCYVLDFIILMLLFSSQHVTIILWESNIDWCCHVCALPSVTLYNCSVGRSDCSRCHTADRKYGCVWCGGVHASCLYSDTCREPVQETCPAPVIHSVSSDILPLHLLLYCGNNSAFSSLYKFATYRFIINKNRQLVYPENSFLNEAFPDSLRLSLSLACWKAAQWWPSQAPTWARRLKTSLILWW